MKRAVLNVLEWRLLGVLPFAAASTDPARQRRSAPSTVSSVPSLVLWETASVSGGMVATTHVMGRFLLNQEDKMECSFCGKQMCNDQGRGATTHQVPSKNPLSPPVLGEAAQAPTSPTRRSSETIESLLGWKDVNISGDEAVEPSTERTGGTPAPNNDKDCQR